MQALIDQLFACDLPYKSLVEKNCFITYSLEDSPNDLTVEVVSKLNLINEPNSIFSNLIIDKRR